MKHKFFLITAVATAFAGQAQNVGVGTATPQAKLHVQNDLEALRIQGQGSLLNFFDPAGSQVGFIRNQGNNSIEIGTRLLSNHPVAIVPGGLAATVFQPNGFVGFGTYQPQARVHVMGDGEALRMQGNGSWLSFYNGNNYIGYLWNKGNNAIDLGTASGSGFPVHISPDNYTAATFLPNGFTGIGVSNPQWRLDVNGRMRIRHNGESPGIFFNNGANTAVRGFVGMENDNEIGFWGSGAGWALKMNVNNGFTQINGSVKAVDYSYVTPQARVYSLGMGDVRGPTGDLVLPTAANGYLDFFTNSTDGLLPLFNTIVVPVHLPAPCTIKKITIPYIDSANGVELAFKLFKVSRFGVRTEIANLATTGHAGFGEIISSTLQSPSVAPFDILHMTIGVTGTSGGSTNLILKFQAIHIEYEVTSP